MKVIECNLRVSRSFPFVSKTLDFDFVALATKVMVGCEDLEAVDVLGGTGKFGVKVPQFSFSRLAGADVTLGVEMSSTGEVACFGDHPYEAYLKAMMSSGFKLPVPPKNILLSIGAYKHKDEMKESVRILAKMGYTLFGSWGTADYFNEIFKEEKIHVQNVQWHYENVGEAGEMEELAESVVSMTDYLSTQKFDLVINLPRNSAGGRRVSSFIPSYGHQARRMAIDYGIALITDVKCAKLLVAAMYNQHLKNEHAPKAQMHVDCVSSGRIVRLPGLIDTHVHLRDPGQTHKEDFESGTKSALAGGVTLLGAMPNTNPPIVDQTTYDLVQGIAEKKAHCDYAIYLGATPNNASAVSQIANQACALKMYCNETFTTLTMTKMHHWKSHIEAWPQTDDVGPLCLHAEETVLAQLLLLGSQRPIHVCHVARRSELELIQAAKDMGLPVTCEVCPHHLFLTEESAKQSLGQNKSQVRPCLVTEEDQKYLWDNLDSIDTIGTDHAPHTIEEKLSAKAPPGFPGLETMLPLMLTAVNQGKLSLEDLMQKMYHNPRKIFNFPEQPNTYVEVNLDEEWVIGKPGFSKAAWSPFEGFKVQGKVKRVVLRGQVVYLDGQILSQPGYGQNVREWMKPNKKVVKLSPERPKLSSRGSLGETALRPISPSPLNLGHLSSTLPQLEYPESFRAKSILNVDMFTRYVFCKQSMYCSRVSGAHKQKSYPNT